MSPGLFCTRWPEIGRRARPSTPLTPYLTGDKCVDLWRMRSNQIADVPTDALWVTRLVLVPGEDAPVGLAGFHGPPDEVGMVEVGYRIDPVQWAEGLRQAGSRNAARRRSRPP